MTLAVCWLGLPLALGLLSLGCGLLLERLCGTRLNGALIAPAGLAVVVVVAQAATVSDATAELGLPAAVLLAAAGLVLARRRPRRLDGWALAAAAGVYLAFALPTVASGEATFAGYVKLDDTSTWLAITDRVLEHGRDLDGLAPSTYEATLHSYVGNGYPIGSFLPLAIAHAILGQDSAWLFQPLLAFLAAILALVLYGLAAPLVPSRPVRAAVALIAAQPALLFAYSLWGGLKELTAAWLLATVAALLAPTLGKRGLSGRRILLPAAVAGAALLAIGSVGAAIWLAAPLLVAVAVWARLGGRRLALLRAGLIAALTIALSVPTLLTARTFLSPGGREALTSSSELGNLAGPLNPFQVLGIWPSGDFRFDPTHGSITAALLAALVAAAIAGVTATLVRRSMGALVFAVSAGLGCLLVAVIGSPWVDAKAFAITSPAPVLVALLGAVVAWHERRRVGALLAGSAIAIGVLWSNALAYHDVNLAPRERLVELERIGERIGGQGPTLMTHYEPYGVRHFLRDADPEGASEFRRRLIPLRSGSGLKKIQTADIDAFKLRAILVYRTLVLRRSPLASRPPSVYRLLWKGRYYELWQRPPASERSIAAHLSLGGELDPAAEPSCREVTQLGRAAGRGEVLATVSRPQPVVRGLDRFDHPTSWGALAGGQVSPAGAGTATATVAVGEPGRYSVWLGGAFRRRVEVRVDGEPTGEGRHRLSHIGAYEPLGQVELSSGTHRVTVSYGDADLHPGSDGQPFPLGPLVLSRSTADSGVTYVRPRDARALCGKRLDWVELVRR